MSTWQEVLDAQSAYLAEVERRLAEDQWDDIGVPPLFPSALHTAPTAAETARAQTLYQRQLDCTHRLAAALDSVRKDLAATDAHRRAGRAYAANTRP